MNNTISVFLHFGITKTGSTAIQNFLENNIESLERAGYYYPLDQASTEESYRSSGNGYNIYLDVVSVSINRQALIERIENRFDAYYEKAREKNCHSIIISSEVFSILSESDFIAFIESLPKSRFEYKYLYFKREPYSWYFSSWLQGVKREGIIKWLDINLTDDIDYSIRPLLISRRLKSTGIWESTIELDYDECKETLIKDFLGAIGLTHESILSLHSQFTPIINRSVTKLEFAIHYSINKVSQGNQQLSEKLSSLVLDKNSDSKKPFFFVDTHVKEIIYDYCLSNNISIHADLSDILPHDYTQVSYTEDLFMDSLDCAEKYLINMVKIVVEYYKNFFDTARQLAVHKIFYYKSSEYKKLVPEFFEPLTYLLLNDDVLFSHLDPYQHYIEWGEKDGRTCSIDTKQDVVEYDCNTKFRFP